VSTCCLIPAVEYPNETIRLSAQHLVGIDGTADDWQRLLTDNPDLIESFLLPVRHCFCGVAVRVWPTC